MSHKWEQTITEKVSPELAHRTLARVRRQLDENQQGQWDWSFIKYLIPASTLGLGLLFYWRHQQNEVSPQRVEDDLILAMEILEDIDIEELGLLGELDSLEDLDLLEDWDGRTEV